LPEWQWQAKKEGVSMRRNIQQVNIVSKLKLPHSSYPANPLLAEPMYLAGFIERMSTGIPDMQAYSGHCRRDESS
jgi:hypothetical protein